MLGVSWKSQEDCFIFKIAVELKDSYTKRCVLSTIARLFDPLGLLGPVVARAKIFMQSLWSLKIDWIDELPSERAKEWHRFLEDFNSVSSICIGRCIVHPQATKDFPERNILSSVTDSYEFNCKFKTVQFELVSDLTTQTFIASIKRFIAKRGRPCLMFSDNDKTFIGADAELKRLYKLVINPDPELAGFLVNAIINWKFLPPRAPNFGSLWGAGRSKWKFEKDNARVGDLVHIKDDNLAVNNWLMGRLIEVFPGKDNGIWVVTIKIQYGKVKRPISKICILPLRE
ncbi:integrase catalytic domain-containing protein [Trichonephila clavipes]|nr:integrase catalytic domain-containing protein [Trichonephila clavipes]